MLNIIWTFFFFVSFLSAVYQTAFLGDLQIWTALTTGIFEAAVSAFTLALNLTGMLCLWLGFLKMAEKAGLMRFLARGLRPVFAVLMPEVPADHPALGSVVMNTAANILGLDNAATPAGLKAMEQLQTLNPHPDKASNAEVMFMVLNASAVTIIPINILMYRMQFHAFNPSAVFIPILLATSVSTLVGILSVALVQHLPVFNRKGGAILLAFGMLIGLVAYGFLSLTPEARLTCSTAVGNALMFLIMVVFLLSAVIKKLPPYDLFIEGAKEGFGIAVRLIPYLVAMLTAIAALRASGVMDAFIGALIKFLDLCGLPTDFAPALPTALMKPLSGSGARALMIETMQNYGADSFPAYVSSVIQGSTETTFYVLAVYFGAVKITRTGAALPCALMADLAGIVAAIGLSYVFY